MKPVVPSTVSYPDMRNWQRFGMKLRGQCNRRCTGTPTREGMRNLPAQGWRGARNEWVRSTYVNL